MCSAVGLPLKNKSLIAERACQGFSTNQIRESLSRACHVTLSDVARHAGFICCYAWRYGCYGFILSPGDLLFL